MRNFINKHSITAAKLLLFEIFATCLNCAYQQQSKSRVKVFVYIYLMHFHSFYFYFCVHVVSLSNSVKQLTTSLEPNYQN